MPMQDRLPFAPSFSTKPSYNLYAPPLLHRRLFPINLVDILVVFNAILRLEVAA